MAIDNQFGKGIGVAAGFDLGAQKPLDARIAVNTIEERDAHVENNRAYEGMLVFVDETKVTYQLINGEWVVFFDNDANTEGAADLAAKNKEQDGRLNALEGAVGKAADGEKEATGLHLAVANAQAAAEAAQNAAEEEADRAAEVESGLQSAIDEIKNEENGILAQAKAHAEDKDAEQKALLDKDIADAKAAVDTEKGRAEGVEAELLGRIVALEGVEGEDGAVVGGVLNEAKAYTDARETVIRTDIQGVTDGHAQRLTKAEGDIDKAEGDIVALQEAVAAIKGGDVEINLSDVNERIAALEAKHGEGEDTVEGKIDAAQEAANKAQEDVDALEAIVGVEAKDAVDGGEAVEATGLFAKIDALQKDIDQNEADCDAAVAAEVTARENAVKGVQDQLDALKGGAEEEGSIAKAIADAVKEEQDRAEDEEARIEGLITQEVTNRGNAVKGVQDALDAQLVEATEGTLANKIKANADAIGTLNGEDTVAGSVKQQIKDAIEGVNGAAEELEKRVKANEDSVKANADAIAIINGEGEGSIKKAVADLVNGAPEALDTLDELAAALRDNEDVLTAIENAFDGKLEALQQDVNQNEADCDSAIEAVNDEIANMKNADLDGSLANLIADEAARADGIEKELDGRIAANEAFVSGHDHTAMENRLKALEDANAEGGAVADAIKAAEDAADAAQAAANVAQGEVDALENVVAEIEEIIGQEKVEADEEQGIAGQEATGLFAEIDALNAAVAKEAQDRDDAIDAALEDYSTTEEVKTILGNVVGSLALSMEENKMKLKLGGVDGITLHETSLDMALDSDIDAIIAGLDENEEEEEI